MSIRALLGPFLIVAALVSASALAHAQSPSIAHASAATDGCVRYVEGQAMVVRCAVAPQVLADHGVAVGEPYDAQGNPVDRHGNVVAVPDRREQVAREVFTSESRKSR